MVADASDGRQRAPSVEALQKADLGREVSLSEPRGCVWCGHTMDVAKVVRVSGRGYAYACLGCAVRT